MVAEEGNKKLRASVLKDKPQIAVAAAFEKLASQLADAETAVHVGLTKAVHQVAKSKKALHFFALWQLAQATDHRGVDGEKLTQTLS
jgi:hypothetical protein